MITLLLLLMTPFTLVGLMTVYLWWNFLQEEGVDSSNVFNPVRVQWFALTKPQKLFDIWPWIKQDEGETLGV